MSASIRSLSLARGAMHRIVNGRGWQIYVSEGELWLTQDCDSRDCLLGAGESFTLDRDGMAIACAMRPAVIILSAPVPARGRSVLARAWSAFFVPLGRMSPLTRELIARLQARRQPARKAA